MSPLRQGSGGEGQRGRPEFCKRRGVLFACVFKIVSALCILLSLPGIFAAVCIPSSQLPVPQRLNSSYSVSMTFPTVWSTKGTKNTWDHLMISLSPDHKFWEICFVLFFVRENWNWVIQLSGGALAWHVQDPQFNLYYLPAPHKEKAGLEKPGLYRTVGFSQKTREEISGFSMI